MTNRTETNNYWNDRFLAVNDKAVMTGMQFYKNAERMFKQAENRIQADMAIWYNRLAVNNKVSYQDAIKLLRKDELKEFHWKVEEYIKHGQESNMSQEWKKELENASAKYHITRLESLLFQMREHLNNLYDEYNRGLLGNLGNVYEEAYYRTAYEIDNRIGTGVSFSRLDEKAIDRILNKPWASDGQNFSDRVWRDKTKLINTLQTELTIGLIRGDAQEKIVKRFAYKMDTSLTNAGRLIATESAYFASVGSLNSLKELGVKEYEYLATLDIKTSPMCRAMDGKIFKIEDFHPGITAPPLHCWCRSTIVPKMDDEKGVERVARDSDGNREYVPSTMKYEEWYKERVVNDDNKKTKQRKNDKIKINDIENELRTCPKIIGKHSADEDIKATNPNYGMSKDRGDKLYTHNCQRCVSAYEARRRGYDVTALPYIKNRADDLPYTEKENGWPNVYKNGRNDLIPIISTTKKNVKKKVIQQMEDWGDKARAIIKVCWRWNSGHVFIAENRNGNIVFLDPQSGNLDVGNYFNYIKVKKTHMLRIDNREFTPLINKCIKPNSPKKENKND